jgi:molybdate transport system substrate-binding protein
MSADTRIAHRPRRRRRLLAVVLVAMAVLVAGCSDAPTEAEIEMADDGIDPSIVSIFVADGLLPVVEELGTIFLIQHPGTTFQYSTKPSEELADRVRDGFRPTLWVDRDDVLEEFADDPATRGPAAPFGEDVFQWVAWEDFPDARKLTLDVFGGGAQPARSGICEPEPPCGVAARAVLDAAGVVPEPDVETESGRDLESRIAKGDFDTALVYRSDASRIYTRFTQLELPDPTMGTLTYETISMADDPVVAEFQNWIVTSPQAQDVLVKRGLRERGSRAAP